MLQQEVAAILAKMYDGKPPKSINDAKLTTALNASGVTNVKGYLEYAREQLGPWTYFGGSNKLYEKTLVEKYKTAEEQEVKDLPQAIVNAGDLYSGLVDGSLSSEDALDRLGDMVQHYALYMLLKASGFEADAYKGAAEEYASKFPAAIRALPEGFQAVKEALLDPSQLA